MGKSMGTDGDPETSWRLLARCRNLTTAEADALFFPGRGGKSKKAEEFCNGCPVRDKCLQEALMNRAVGFWAGTTEPERQRMIDFLRLVPSQLDNFIPEPTLKNRRLRKIPVSDNIYSDPLYGVEGPSLEEELRMYGL